MKGESLVPTALVLMLNTEHMHSYSDVHIHKYYNIHIHSQVHVNIAHEKYCGIEMLSHTLCIGMIYGAKTGVTVQHCFRLVGNHHHDVA